MFLESISEGLFEIQICFRENSITKFYLLDLVILFHQYKYFFDTFAKLITYDRFYSSISILHKYELNSTTVRSHERKTDGKKAFIDGKRKSAQSFSRTKAVRLFFPGKYLAEKTARFSRQVQFKSSVF